jgi:hypothetical protein
MAQRNKPGPGTPAPSLETAEKAYHLDFSEESKVALSVKFSDLQLRELHAAFKILDKDGEGMISAEDLYKTYISMGEEISKQQCIDYIESTRCLKYQGLTFAEFLVFISNGVRYQLDANPGWRRSVEASGTDITGASAVPSQNVQMSDLFKQFCRGEEAITKKQFLHLCSEHGLLDYWTDENTTAESTFDQLSGGQPSISYQRFAALLQPFDPVS